MATNNDNNEIKRMKYYDGLFLKAEEFILEQNYHIRMHRLHNRYLHNIWGIIEGLDVKPINNTKKFKVTKGVAIAQITTDTGECHAVEIVLPKDYEEVDLSSFASNTEVYITISYAETEKDTDPNKGEKPIHIVEHPKIEAKMIAPSDPKKEIILAKIKIPAGSDWKSQDATIVLDDRKNIQIITAEHTHDGTTSPKIPAIDSTHFANLSGANLIDIPADKIKGVIPETKIDQTLVREKTLKTHTHDGTTSPKIPAIDSTHFANLSGANLININPNNISGIIPEAKIDQTLVRDEELKSLLPLIREKHIVNQNFSTNSKTFVDISDLTLSFTTNRDAMLLCIFNASPAGNDTAGTRTYWQMLFDNNPIGFAMKHTQNPWALDSVIILTAQYAVKGAHTVKIQWRVSAGTGYCPHINPHHGDVGMRGLTVVESPTIIPLEIFNTLATLTSSLSLASFHIRPR